MLLLSRVAGGNYLGVLPTTLKKSFPTIFLFNFIMILAWHYFLSLSHYNFPLPLQLPHYFALLPITSHYFLFPISHYIPLQFALPVPFFSNFPFITYKKSFPAVFLFNFTLALHHFSYLDNLQTFPINLHESNFFFFFQIHRTHLDLFLFSPFYLNPISPVSLFTSRSSYWVDVW